MTLWTIGNVSRDLSRFLRYSEAASFLKTNKSIPDDFQTIKQEKIFSSSTSPIEKFFPTLTIQTVQQSTMRMLTMVNTLLKKCKFALSLLSLEIQFKLNPKKRCCILKANKPNNLLEQASFPD